MFDENLEFLNQKKQNSKEIPFFHFQKDFDVADIKEETVVDPKAKTVTHDKKKGEDEFVFPKPKIRNSNVQMNLNPQRYQYRGKLGVGGMGMVISVFDSNLNRTVAAKLAHPDIQQNRKQLKQFITEAQITSQLEHPNIVPIHEIGLDEEGEVFFTMKKVQGNSLSKVIKNLSSKCPKTCRKYTQNELLRCFRKICDAVAFAHTHDVIHQDLKPDNIMIGEFGEILVLDWGIAKILQKPVGFYSSIQNKIKTTYSDLSSESSFYGTPPYMSPEQCLESEQPTNECSDIYSLGAILFEMFAYIPPALGKTAEEVMFNTYQGNRLRIEKLAPKTPKELIAIINKCLENKSKCRYQKVEELAQDIDAFIDDLPVSCYKGSLKFRAKKWIRHHPTGVGIAGGRRSKIENNGPKFDLQK